MAQMTEKKGSKKKAETPAAAAKKPAKLAPLPDTKPSVWNYVRATTGLAWSWIKANKKKTAIILAVSLIVVVGLVTLLRPSPGGLTNDEIVTQINKELSISGDGNPAVLEVVDKSKVEQPFLDQSENGDKVVLYYKAGRAVLYRPSEERIVHQGTYTPPDAKVFIRAGTGDGAKIDQVRSELEQIDDVDIVSQDTSTKQDYQGIVVVSVTDRYDEAVQQIARELGGTISRLPAGETFPDADILVIVGN